MLTTAYSCSCLLFYPFLTVYRGRTVSYLTAPAQIPACGIIAPGFSEVFASAKALSQARDDAHGCAFGTYYDTWFSDVKPLHQLIEANPIVTLALTAPIEKFPQRPDGIEIERIETGKVAIYTEIIIVPAQFCVQCFEQFWYFAMTVFLAPKGEAFLGFSEGLASSALINMRFAHAIFAPSKLETKKVKTGHPQRFRAKGDNLRFLCG